MDVTPLSISGAFSVTTRVHHDGRGQFVEWFRGDVIERQTGLAFSTVQANLSVSQEGTLRGIHFADVPPGQAKYVMCATGSILDYVVDIRVGSPTFGAWEAVTLSAGERNAVLLNVGLGHAFVALEQDTTVIYLVTDCYKPLSEHGINPRDPDIGLKLPFSEERLVMSEKDMGAPSLAEALTRGILPEW